MWTPICVHEYLNNVYSDPSRAKFDLRRVFPHYVIAPFQCLHNTNCTFSRRLNTGFANGHP